MHHPTDRIAHTTAFVNQSWSTGWNETIQSEHSSRPDLLNRIQHLQQPTTTAKLDLKLEWVPAHVGINGNENADNFSKTKSLEISDQHMCNDIPYSTTEIITKKTHKKNNTTTSINDKIHGTIQKIHGTTTLNH